MTSHVCSLSIIAALFTCDLAYLCFKKHDFGPVSLYFWIKYAEESLIFKHAKGKVIKTSGKWQNWNILRGCWLYLNAHGQRFPSRVPKGKGPSRDGKKWIDFVKQKWKDFDLPTPHSVLCEKHCPPGSYPMEYELKKSMNPEVRKKRILPHAVPTIQTVGNVDQCTRTPRWGQTDIPSSSPVIHQHLSLVHAPQLYM